MNEFSLLCRVLGSLFYRQPQDPVLAPVYDLIRGNKLAANWPLEQDELLARLAQNADAEALSADYNALFTGEDASVSPYRSAWVAADDALDVRQYLTARGMPLPEGAVDHFGMLLLAASWLEDQRLEDETEALTVFFADYLLPWCGTFLGKVEAHATTAFWRTMAMLTRDAIQAMWDDLQEEDEE
ncbi:molecular chaperone [Shimwellia pseudoproteus]|uniref:TorD/DmsD family molecular chaperone n=1 Tax=Shimwellia pseudoproteus TaxID=570012 RepID=UPI0018ED5B31|nr:molecular chaperone [Shimwellia pseudoproteus]MBJ3815966.1 molecular chaperone [Shimwellia pseudoproteus]